MRVYSHMGEYMYMCVHVCSMCLSTGVMCSYHVPLYIMWRSEGNFRFPPTVDSGDWTKFLRFAPSHWPRRRFHNANVHFFFLPSLLPSFLSEIEFHVSQAILKLIIKPWAPPVATFQVLGYMRHTLPQPVYVVLELNCMEFTTSWASMSPAINIKFMVSLI